MNIILMADIEKSGTKNSIETMNSFKQIVENSNAFFKRNIISPLTITLGDEFQGIINNIESAVKIIYYIDEFIIKNNINFKLRYVINEGEIDTEINTIISYEMLGQGLTDARNQLNELKKTKYKYYISLSNKIKSKIINESFVIYQETIENWNIKKDYELLSKFIELEDYKKVALATNKDKSQIWKRNKTLNFDSYFAIKRIILLTVNLKIKK